MSFEVNEGQLDQRYDDHRAIRGATLGSHRTLLFVRDPFRKVTVPELFAAAGFDRNTRVMVFVKNLELNPGENPNLAVIVRMIDFNNQVFEVFAEDFRAVPDTDLMQVVFRLPNSISPGSCAIIIRAHGRFSNVATIRIAP